MKNPRASKRQLEEARRVKAEQKRQRRTERAAAAGDEQAAPAVDEGAVLAALARLHETYKEGTLSLEAFELERDELTSRLHVD
ncbi:MAG: hypothetical protein HZB15_12375 [Actinobacteria bacterium]|nr:hypothetical protein [Actinomycetota bacterium]